MFNCAMAYDYALLLKPSKYFMKLLKIAHNFLLRVQLSSFNVTNLFLFS